MQRTNPTRPRFRPVVLVPLVLAALAAGAVAHAPREASAQRSSATPRGFLGVSLQDLTASLRESYDYQGSGVLVSDVVPGSPADKAGVREGDILLRLDDDTVEDAAEVTAKVRALKPGTLLGITVVRDGDTRVLSRAEIADLATAREDGDVWVPAPPATPRAPRPPRPPRVSRAPHGHMNVMSGRGRLGIETHDLDADLAPYFKTTADAGVLVLRVLDETPAEKAGLKAGDVITTVGGKAVGDGQELRRVLQEREAGDVELRLLRAGETRTLTARLESSSHQNWNWQSMPGSENWMGWLEDMEDRPGVYHFEFDDDDKERIKAKLKDIPWNDGRVRIYRDLDDLEDMDPEERAKFEREMKELREEMQELLRDMKELRDEAEDDD